MPSPLLYRSDNAYTWLIDLPESIACAQGLQRRLLSTSPITEPYPSTEPKGLKHEQFLARTPEAERLFDALICASLSEALEDLGRHPVNRWCLPRLCVDDHVEILRFKSVVSSDQVGEIHASPPLVLSAGHDSFDDLQTLTSSVAYNPHDHAVKIVVLGNGGFWVPARSAFLSSAITRGERAFRTAARFSSFGRSISQGAIAFDLVLLDPPWANRSVRRGRKYVSTDEQSSDPFIEVLPILQQHLAPDAYIAVWITNKVKIRQQVIGALEEIGFLLTEEWVWLKITTAGVPVLPIGGLWRKPYECLLIFSPRSGAAEVVRRSIFAVPDHHSQKPNLKLLFEQLLSLPENYNALEVFARNLVAGWWSWGDEVLKFQHESCWTL